MRKDLILIAIVVATLALMVIPLRPALIDLLLATNMSLAVLLLMVALYLRTPSDFSTFPSVILIGTAFRLALSVGTTRLILTEAEGGHIIQTFGEFVAGGSVGIGLVIFLVITVVQFLVVTKGAERVAEVAARFALDALPGKQMSIDAELRAGNIEAEVASARRRRLDRDSQFFGAMDGAMKFVKGDAIAGLIIIFINLFGGVVVGTALHGLSFAEAIAVFSLLTIGDGLVAQIPSLLMSLSAGVVVTRTGDKDNSDLGSDIFKELIADPRVSGVAACIVLGMGFIPGFPFFVFAGIALVLLASTLVLRSAIRKRGQNAAEVAVAAAPTEPEAAGHVLPAASDRIRVVLGAEAAQGINIDDLELRIVAKMEQLFTERGVRFPRIAADVSNRHGARTVAIEIDEVRVFKSPLQQGVVAIRGDADLSAIVTSRSGEPPEPLAWTDLKGIWIAERNLPLLDGLGYEAIPVEGALAHLAFRIYERNLGTLFSNAIFMQLRASMQDADPAAMREIEDKIERPALHRLLRYMVEDGVPVRPLSLLVASLHYWLHSLDKPRVVTLADALRGSMKRQLCDRIAGPDGLLGILLLDPALETAIRRNLQESNPAVGNDGTSFALTPKANDALLGQLRELLSAQDSETRLPAIVTAPDLRRAFRNYLAMHDIHLAVLGANELVPEISTYPLALLKAPHLDGDDAQARKTPKSNVLHRYPPRQPPGTDKKRVAEPS
jgi:type III secretion protein V